MFEKGSTSGMKGDSEPVVHEPSSRLDPIPRLGYFAEKSSRNASSAQCDAVFDVRREVVGPGRRYHVDLQAPSRTATRQLIRAQPAN